MIAANHDGRAQFAVADHFIEGQAQLVAHAEADPADARGQALECNAFARHVQPVVQMLIVRDEFLDLGIGLVDVFRIATERDPAERADTFAKQWPHIGRHEAGEIERIGATDIERHLPDIVAVIHGRDANGVEGQHRLHVHAHRLLGGITHAIGI